MAEFKGNTRRWKGDLHKYKLRYQKWSFYVDQIMKKANFNRFQPQETNMFIRIRLACRAMDVEREQLKASMAKYYDILKERAGLRGVRGKRKRDDDSDNGISL